MSTEWGDLHLAALSCTTYTAALLTWTVSLLNFRLLFNFAFVCMSIFSSYAFISLYVSGWQRSFAKMTIQFADPDYSFGNMRFSSFSYLSGTSLGASVWQTWTWNTRHRRSIWKAGLVCAGSCAPAGEACEWRSSGKSGGFEMHLNEICLLQLRLRFFMMEIKSYSTFPAFALPLPLHIKLLNVVWMKPGRSKIKTHDYVSGPKVTATLTS